VTDIDDVVRDTHTEPVRTRGQPRDVPEVPKGDGKPADESRSSGGYGT
jgi:hypothetical protein